MVANATFFIFLVLYGFFVEPFIELFMILFWFFGHITYIIHIIYGFEEEKKRKKRKKKNNNKRGGDKKRRGKTPPLLFKETPKWRLFELKTATKKNKK